MQNRYLGHTHTPYTVANHSILVAEMVPSHLQFQALMHDAHEAIVGDVPGPIKDALRVYGDAWERLEAEIAHKVRKWFRISPSIHPAIAKADRDIRKSEIRDLFTPQAIDAARSMGVRVEKSGATRRIFPLTQQESYDQFLAVYRRVGNGM